MFTLNQLLELMVQIMGAFQERFNKAPPRKATLLAFGFGSVKDRPRSGKKKKTREETCAGNNLLSSRHVNVLRNSVYRGQQCEITWKGLKVRP
ncbi:hypothetical protein C0J52_12574 [Blattella germanica]|nr:hypothetical protein C0J52_12574 [Blattella germanica]